MKNKAYRVINQDELKERLIRILRFRTGDKLTYEQLEKIYEAVGNEQCKIVFTQEPDVFLKRITLKNSADCNREHTEKGTFVFGKFVFGSKKDSNCGNKVIYSSRNAVFDITEPATALIEVNNRGYDDLSVLMNQKDLIIFIPKFMNEGAVEDRKAG